jgi:AraC-like DNA-binding protein
MSSATSADGIHYFGPPYETLEQRPTMAWSDALALRGYAVVWSIGGRGRQKTELRMLREKPPSLPLIVLLPPAEEIRRALPVLHALPTLDARSVLPGSALGSPDRLRAVLALRPRSLPNAVGRYLERRGVLRTDRIRREVRRIIELAPDTKSITRLCRRMYTSRRTLGRHFSDHGLPVPSHWLQFARLLHVTVHLQDHPGAIFRIAARFGYPDGFTMSNQMYRLIGVRPTEVRRLLGWEWVVESWLRREVERGGMDGGILR